MFTLPPLPWPKDSLASKGISQETIEFHYGKHHQGYINKLNAAVKGTDLEKKTLEELIKSQSGKVFNCAAQSFNHAFYWKCLSANGGGEPTGKIGEEINKQFGGFDKFKEQFTAAAGTHFGSGWAWLVRDDSNKVRKRKER